MRWWYCIQTSSKNTEYSSHIYYCHTINGCSPALLVKC